MRWVNFNLVNIERDGPKVSVLILKDVPVNADSVCFVAPATIPTEIAGPGGHPMGKPGAQLQFAAAAILVDCSREMALWKLANESVDTSRKPEEEEPLQTSGKKPTLKLIHPDK